MSQSRRLSRRRVMEGAGIVAAGTALAACGATPTPVVIEKTVEVEKVVTQVVQQEVTKIVEGTPQVVKETVVVQVTAAGPTPIPVGSASGEFTFWYPNQQYGEWLRDEFNKLGTSVTAKWELGEYDSNTKTMAALAAGNPPPVSYLGRWQTCDLAVRNAIIALDDYIATAQHFKWDNIWTRLQKDSVSWGKKWIIPYTTDTRALIYNKDIMSDAGLDPEAPPKTFDELHDMAVKITKLDSAGRIDRIGFTPTFGNPPGYLIFLSLLWCMNSDMVNESMTKVTITDKGVEAMQYLKNLMHDQGGYDNAVAFTKSLSLAEGLDAFSAGKVGLAMNGQWVLKNYDKYAPNLNYGMIPGPVFPEFNIHCNYDGGGGWFFFKKGGHFPEAWTFVDAIMDKDFQTRFADLVATLPSRSDAGEAWAKLDKRRPVFAETANTVKWIPIFAGIIESLSSLATMYDNILIGGADMKSEIEAAQTKIQALLDKHNSFPVPS